MFALNSKRRLPVERGNAGLAAARRAKVGEACLMP